MKNNCKYIFGCEYDYGYMPTGGGRGFCGRHYSAYYIMDRRTDLKWSEIERITESGTDLEKESIRIVKKAHGPNAHQSIAKKIKGMKFNAGNTWN